jgi:sphingomyelin phosphodiesterase acid-like 3
LIINYHTVSLYLRLLLHPMIRIKILYRIAFITIVLWLAGYVSTFAQGRCLIVSDIHFNPDTGYKLQYGHDSNYGLLKQSVSAMQQKIPNPDLIIIAGDFIWHGVRGTAIPKETKTAIIDSIASLFRQYFPHVPVITTLGNNDTYQADYDIQDTAFLNMFANSWEHNGVKMYNAPFRQDGYYTFNPDKFAKLRFIVINGSLLSYGSKSKGYGSKADTMLKWLGDNLLDAKNKGEKVWILSHIPPGKNVYEVLGNKPDTLMWDNPYSQIFTDLVVKYASIIKLNIASHTHFNDFRVFCDAAGHAVSYMRLVPSISPNHYNNPSFEVADFDKDYTLTKETTYYLDLKRLSPGGSIAATDWQQSSGIGTIGLGSITPASLLKFIEDHSSAQSPVPNDYIQFFNVGALPKQNGINLAGDTFYKYLVRDILKGDE